MFKGSRRVSIRARITLGFGVILVLLAAIGARTTLSLIDATQLSRTFGTMASLSADVGGGLIEFQASSPARRSYVLTVEQDSSNASRTA